MTQRVARQTPPPPRSADPPLLPSAVPGHGPGLGDLERVLESHREQALLHLKARRFAAAQAEFAQAFSLIHCAQKTNPAFTLSLAVVAGLAYPYGALLTRLGDFAAATQYLTEARHYLRFFEARALRKGRYQVRQYCRLSRGGVDLELAYVALRQRAYAQAVTQAARLCHGPAPRNEPRSFRNLRASAHLIIAQAHYAQRQYAEALARARQALTIEPGNEDAETVCVLALARLFQAEGKYEDARSVAVTGCRRFLGKLGIACGEEASALTQATTLLRVIWQSRLDPQVWAQVMPDEREQIGEFLVILGGSSLARRHTTQAIPLFLVAGTFLPPADQIDMPEFELVTRSLGERAVREPVAFATLETVVTHSLVLRRWEFLEAVVEALGRIPLSPALARLAALKTLLPPHLPSDTGALLEALVADLEQTVGIDRQLASALGLRVLSNTSVRFVIKAPVPGGALGVYAGLIERIAQYWKIGDIGLADPEPSTPETERLTDALEEELVRRYLTLGKPGVPDDQV